METVLIQYPFEKVFHRLQKIQKQKGFVITSTNEMDGKIKAHRRRFLQKSLLLDINTSRIDDKATRVDLKINGEPGLNRKRIPFRKNPEQELWNSIYNSF